MRRDLEHRLRSGGARPRAARPRRAARDVPPLRVPRAARPRRRARRGRARRASGSSPATAVPWREELSNSLSRRAGRRSRPTTGGSRSPPATRSSSAPRPAPLDGDFVAHDAKALRVDATDDTMILAYLIEPGRSEYLLDDLAAEYDVEPSPSPRPKRRRRALVRHAAVTLRLRDPLLERVRERGAEPLYRDVEMPLTARPRRHGEGRRQASTRTAWARSPPASPTASRSSRRAAYELAGEEFVIGSPQQLARILFEKLELTPGRKGKTGYSTDTSVLRTIRAEHEIVAVIEEWRELLEAPEHVPRSRCPTMIGEDGRLHTTFNQTVAATGRLSTSNPNLQAIPIRTDLGARSARRSSPSRARGSSPPTTRRSSCASSRTSPASRSCARRSRAGRTSTRRPRPRCSATTRRR